MARPRKSTHKLAVTRTLRISEIMDDRLRSAAERFGKDDGETVRLLLEIGLTFANLANFDIPGSVIDRAFEIFERRKKEGDK